MTNEVPTLVTREFILNKCTSFVDFQLWPMTSVLDFQAWLSNFTPAETEHALHLLNAFLFFSEPMVDQLFAAAFQDLSNLKRRPNESFKEASQRWRAFCASLRVTIVTGENPSLTDSGFIFARKARQVLGLDHDQFLSPEAAVRYLMAGGRRLLFVDDFAGSGNQFIETWGRKYDVGGGATYSFKDFAATTADAEFYYCPAIATQTAIIEIDRKCGAQVRVNPGNVLANEYSAVHPQSVVWPPHLNVSGPQFIERVSTRVGIPDTNGGEDDWRGFWKLGLCIAFSHSVPDATLPLFYWEQNGWKPLLRRR